MTHRASTWNRVGLLVLGIAVVAAAAWISTGALAPTTEGLILHATHHTGGAAAGNRNEISIFVSAYNAAGPIRGLGAGSFNLVVVAAPDGANPLKMGTVSEPSSGIYRISVSPDLSSHRWSAGKYVMSITFTSPNGSGVVLADVTIGS